MMKQKLKRMLFKFQFKSMENLKELFQLRLMLTKIVLLKLLKEMIDLQALILQTSERLSISKTKFLTLLLN